MAVMEGACSPVGAAIIETDGMFATIPREAGSRGVTVSVQQNDILFLTIQRRPTDGLVLQGYYQMHQGICTLLEG